MERKKLGFCCFIRSVCAMGRGRLRVGGRVSLTLPHEAIYALTYKEGIAPSAGWRTLGSFLAPSEHHPSCLTCFLMAGLSSLDGRPIEG